MPLDFGVGEIASRVRRALTVVGRMPLDLDERLGVQVQAYDVERSPWRSDGARFYGSGTISPIAAQFPYVGLGNVAAGAGAMHVIDGAWVTNINAAILDVAMGWSPNQLTGTLMACRYSELGNPLATAFADSQFRAGPANVLGQNTALDLLPVPNIVVSIPANTTMYIPLEETIQIVPGTVNYYVAKGLTLNTGLRVSWTGRSWTRQPQSAP